MLIVMLSATVKYPVLRVAAVAAAVALASAGITGLLHRANTAHVVCTEHGTELHLEQAVGHHSPVNTLDGAPDVGTSDQHKHCGLCPTSRETDVVNEHAAAPIAPPPADAGSELAAVEHDRPLSVALYRTAPKASPPLFA